MITPENAYYIDCGTDEGIKGIFNRLIQTEESQPNRIMRKRVENFDKSCIRYKIKISAEQTKLTTNSKRRYLVVMHIKGSYDGPKLEILSRTEQATAALKKLKQTYL